MKKTFSLLIALFLGLNLLAQEAVDSSNVLLDGQEMPEFKITTMDGKSISSADLKGKLVLINFFATWCGPCAQEFPELEQFYRGVDKKRFEVFAISSDEGGKPVVDAFIAGRTFNMQILLDADNRVTADYRIRAYPTTMIVSGNGKILGELNGARQWRSKAMTELIGFLARSKSLEDDFQKASKLPRAPK